MTPATSAPPQAPFSAGTGLADAQQNQAASSAIMVANLNSNLKVIYLTAFNNWALSVLAARIPNTNPPQPPTGYVVSAPDAEGFQWPVMGTAPVCDMPPVPADTFTAPVTVPNTISVGSSIGGAWFSVGAGDTFKPGMTTPPVTSADGVTGTFEKFAAPVGAGWYLKTS